MTVTYLEYVLWGLDSHVRRFIHVILLWPLFHWVSRRLGKLTYVLCANNGPNFPPIMAICTVATILYLITHHK